MATFESFDDFESTEKMDGYSDIPPFQFREDTGEEGTLEWLKQNFERKYERAQSRLDTYARFQDYYKGIFWKNGHSSRRYNDDYYNGDRRKPKMSVNFIYDKTMDRVAQMDRVSAAITLVPSHNEQSDINNAKACTMLLKARQEEIGFQELMNMADQTKFTFGDSYSFVCWNPELGPKSPLYEKWMNKSPVTKKGKKIKKEAFKGEINIGDVDLEILGPDRVFPQIGKKKWCDVDELDRIDFVNIWELKKTYPKKADLIELNDSDYIGLSSNYMGTSDDDNILVKTFYHKKTKWCPGGAKIIWVNGAILSWEYLPYEDGELPCIKDSDIDVYGELFGRSYIGVIEKLQLMYNNVQSSQARDYGVGSAPKWVMQKGSAKVSALNNEFTIVEYTGPVAPKLETPRPTNPQSFDFQDRIEDKLTRLSRTSDISRGEPPAGVTANSALRFLDEQESRMVAPMEKKRKRRIVDISKMMLSRMQQYYKPSDGRMVRILGKDNAYMIKSFESADFTKVYDVKIQHSSALPDAKSGKISTIVDLNIATQTDPVFKKEEIVEMLDLGLDSAFVDGATVAVTAAKTLVESMLNGEKVPEPQEYDNFMVYYTIIDRAMQAFSFRTSVDEVTQETFKQYVKVLEGLMWTRAERNPKFAMELSTLDNYPMFWSPPVGMGVNSLLQMHQAQMIPQEQGGIDTTNMKENVNAQTQGDQ